MVAAIGAAATEGPPARGVAGRAINPLFTLCSPYFIPGMDPPARRFPPSWKAVRTPGGYKIEEANGLALAYVYARGEHGGVNNDGLTVNEARRIAGGMARLPELMGRT